MGGSISQSIKRIIYVNPKQYCLLTFFEINNMTVLGEVAFESMGLMLELSFGTHFSRLSRTRYFITKNTLLS